MTKHPFQRLVLSVLFCFVFCSSASAAIEEPELYKNLNNYPNDGATMLGSFDGELYIQYTTPETGYELFKISAPGAAPVLVKDIVPGPDSSFPSQFRVFKDHFFFSASTPLQGYEPWISDGTTGGTQLLEDLNPGPDSSFPEFFDVFFGGERLVFFAQPLTGSVACVYNGTSTTCSSELARGGNDYTAGVAFNDHYIYSCQVSGDGYELCKVDASGVVSQIKDINSGSASSYPEEFYVIEGKGVVFAADNGTNGIEPWYTNGKTAGTGMIKDVNSGSSDSSPADFAWHEDDGYLFFAATDSTYGREPRSSDLTLGNVDLIKDIYPGPESSNPRYPVFFNHELYFSAEDDSIGEELWRTTSGPGVESVADIYPGHESSYPYFLRVLGSHLIFVAYHPDTGEEWWISDGTPSGTQIGIDVHPGARSSYPYQYAEVNGRLAAVVWGPNGPGIAQTNSGTPTLAGITDTFGVGDRSGRPENFIPLGEKTAFFSFRDEMDGEEPRIVDLETGAVTLLKDINPGERHSRPNPLGVTNGKLLFSAESPEHGTELWITDGTPGGTNLVKDIVPGPEGSYPARLSGFMESLPDDYTGEILFGVREVGYGTVLYKTDGTDAGTVLLKRFDMGSSSFFNPSILTPYKGRYYFWARDVGTGFEVFVTDLTPAGTKIFKDINPGSGNASPASFYVHDDLLFFKATGSGGDEMYRSDGTEVGTELIDLTPGSSGSSPSGFAAFNGQLFFTAKDPTTHAYALFKIQAPYTVSELELVKVFDPASTSFVGGPQVLAGNMYFYAPTPSAGSELWVSDGTVAGTKMLKDINPGTNSSSITSFQEVAGLVYFKADDGVHGDELWRTDGTTAGTVLVKDINPGVASSYPRVLATHYGAWYFEATTVNEGTELWRVLFDKCPADTSKDEFGECGCGVSDLDSDADGIVDCSDACASDKSKIEPGQCGCGIADSDTDGDSVVDCVDLCPSDAAKSDPGVCGCGVVDSDLNGNGITDCLFVSEFSARVDLLQDAVKKLIKSGKSKKKKKKSNTRKRAAKSALLEMLSYFDIRQASISSDNTGLPALVTSAEKAVNKAMKTIKRSSFKKYKKKATNAVKLLQEATP
ncbi:MAG: hypothetical protein KDD62_02780 [Bdellovibrionales bacterium]|nr:hypothetical protein [Bdellovibrionales bacterium]